MAASTRLKLFRPLNVWLAVNGVTLILMVAVVASITSLAREEARRLVQLQVDTLLRARIHDIERGEYRSFVEGVGGELGQVSVAITAPEGVFAHGPTGLGVCATTVVPRAGGEVAVRLCREASRPSRALVAVLLAYGVVAVGIWLLLGRLEARAVGQLLGFFAGLGVRGEPRAGLVGLLAQVKGIVVELDDARKRELAWARQTALAETARQVAHDIRSPLAALRTVLRVHSGNGAASREQRLADHALTRIEAIADDLLARGRAARSAPVALAPLIEGVVEERRASLPLGCGIDLVVVGAADRRAATAVCDPALFSRIISNLLNNAVEALLVGGRVEVEVQVQVHAGLVECRVTDDGCGIQPEVLPRLMQAGATFGKRAGSGLGLHHARTTAETWGGTLTIASAPGVGTTVTLALPLAEPRPPLAPQSDTCDVRDADAVVVLIDDDIWVREAWELAGAEAGASVRTFASFAACEGALSGIPRDAAIYVDLELDGEHGADVGRTLSERGFANLYLSTGHAPSDLGELPLPWFKGVVGKEPRIASAGVAPS
jgi:signal transduction histidine kinase